MLEMLGDRRAEYGKVRLWGSVGWGVAAVIVGALIESVSCIRRGIADLMISGASGTRINTTRLNYRNDLPIADVADPISESSRPHDPRSVGVVGGEGAATVVVESLEHAASRDAKPIALIAGTSSRFVASGGMRSGTRSTAPDRDSGRGSADAIELAIDGARLVRAYSLNSAEDQRSTATMRSLRGATYAKTLRLQPRPRST